MSQDGIPCPGCGLSLPPDASAHYSGYYHTSPECWSLYAEVLAEEYGNAVLFGQVHQLTVDAYAVQHAGGAHPDKSVGIHLCGLHLMFERGAKPTAVPPLHQHLARSVRQWPHFTPPPGPSEDALLTVLDVALAESPAEHAARSRAWATQVWGRWAPLHDEVTSLVARHLEGG